jgi:hypothetical protein
MATPTRGPSVGVLAIQAGHVCNIVDQLRRDLETVAGANPDAIDRIYLQRTAALLVGAEALLVSVRSGLQITAERQPVAVCAMTPAEAAQEAIARG